ncbi:hypothetical protein PN450_19385 [Dolichospermum lemmermannii CS-548]|uniref:hypothetical protein n=1 Tax=Dolichospermum lemmermannii TaxID=54295 RepID=UPI00232E6FEB|nr:hypothetical protein [Dolichospermum lemmermannii]MDB9438909.1 hypothetical protein [Dolichospermum lemmermannii CS-548]
MPSPAVISAIISATGIASSTAIGIAGIIQGNSGSTGDRESLVIGLCEQLRHKLSTAGRSQYTVVMHKSGLNVEMQYQQGGYIDFVQLGGAGYNIYFVAYGYIKNNGARGFDNWCVCGNQKQHDNVITFS